MDLLIISTMTGLTKAVVCAILNIKDILLLTEKSNPCSGSSGFLLHYSNGPLHLLYAI